MNIFQAIVLGIVQGLTEYLPISSSAHLVLVPYWLGWQFPADQTFVFDVVVQLGTLAAVIVYFWKDLRDIVLAMVRCLKMGKPFAEQDARIGWYVALATIPAGLAGMTIRKAVEAAFNNPMITALLLLVTAAMLILGEMLGKQTRELKQITWVDALIVGVFQAIAIFPGISRSGATITAGLLRQVDRKSAARFSFLMSIPIMLAAGLVEIKRMVTIPNVGGFAPAVIIGTLTAGIVGYLSIKWLLGYLTKHSLSVFSAVCFCSWLITFIVSIVRK